MRILPLAVALILALAASAPPASSAESVGVPDPRFSTIPHFLQMCPAVLLTAAARAAASDPGRRDQPEGSFGASESRRSSTRGGEEGGGAATGSGFSGATPRG